MYELMNKKVLVAGGTGFIGHNLVGRLVELGCDVRATFNTNRVRRHKGAFYVKCDLTNEKIVCGLLRTLM